MSHLKVTVRMSAPCFCEVLLQYYLALTHRSPDKHLVCLSLVYSALKKLLTVSWPFVSVWFTGSQGGDVGDTAACSFRAVQTPDVTRKIYLKGMFPGDRRAGARERFCHSSWRGKYMHNL